MILHQIIKMIWWFAAEVRQRFACCAIVVSAFWNIIVASDNNHSNWSFCDQNSQHQTHGVSEQIHYYVQHIEYHVLWWKKEKEMSHIHRQLSSVAMSIYYLPLVHSICILMLTKAFIHKHTTHTPHSYMSKPCCSKKKKNSLKEHSLLDILNK